MTPDEQEQLLADAFKEEIVRQLIIEAGGDGTDDDVKRVWPKCGGNPWDAGIIWYIIKAADNMPPSFNGRTTGSQPVDGGS